MSNFNKSFDGNVDKNYVEDYEGEGIIHETEIEKLGSKQGQNGQNTKIAKIAKIVKINFIDNQ